MRFASSSGRLRRPTPRLIRMPLIFPIVVLVLLTSAGMVAIEERSFRAEARRQLQVRGSAGLEDLTREVQRLGRAHETFARLLADTPGLASALRRGDAVALRRLLGPIQANQAFDEVTIYDRNGTEVLHLGPPKGDRIDASLFASAVSGHTASQAVVNPEGLVVLASTPITNLSGVPGVVTVTTTLRDAELADLKNRKDDELAFFQNGNLVATSVRRADLLEVLRTAPLTGEGIKALNQRLEAFDLQASSKRLGPGEDLLALASSADVRSAANQRRLVVLSATGLLLVALPLIGFFLTRTVVRPLRAMATTAEQMRSGDYSGRVARSRIPELDALASAVNHLAERVEDQLADLSYQAYHDRLTDLPNRALFLDRLEHALVQAERRGESVVVVFLDVDDFKLINDSLGHGLGDQLLVAVAERLRRCLRAADTLARLGGDEFTVLLEGVTRLEDALVLAERIRRTLLQPFHVDDKELFISASIGMTVSTGRDAPDVLLREADLAMYRAKTAGKARCEVFDQTMSAQLEDRLALQTDLRRALEHDELRVHYQPIVDLATGEIVEVEALVRWQHPQRGLVPPLQFIPLAEEIGAIAALGQWVLTEACRQLRNWQHQRQTPLAVSVNLSPRQFQHAELVADITGVLQETRLAPQLLKLEITETIVMEEGESTLRKLKALTDLGVQLVVDDFGVGYSALSYLKRFPFQGLKIDKSFVDGVSHNPADMAIVRAVIMFAKALGLVVTAEGIESHDQAVRLLSLGCDKAQGYYFSRPLPAEEIVKVITSQVAGHRYPVPTSALR
jgi:diguanylate cyclase (GGDEF)-like protein